jgi:Resolvase, N terminal domain
VDKPRATNTLVVRSRAAGPSRCAALATIPSDRLRRHKRASAPLRRGKPSASRLLCFGTRRRPQVTSKPTEYETPAPGVAEPPPGRVRNPCPKSASQQTLRPRVLRRSLLIALVSYARLLHARSGSGAAARRAGDRWLRAGVHRPGQRRALDERAELARVLDHARDGDTVVDWRLDRLGRSLHHLVDTITELEGRRIALRLTQEEGTLWQTSRQPSAAGARIGNSANERRRRAPVIRRPRKRNSSADATRRPRTET